jgi:hypothetical protein
VIFSIKNLLANKLEKGGISFVLRKTRLAEEIEFFKNKNAHNYYSPSQKIDD